MDDVFLKLVNLSISASWLILAVLVLRVVLKKAPKWVMPLLWGVVALRLVCLFSIESALSLIPSAAFGGGGPRRREPPAGAGGLQHLQHPLACRHGGAARPRARERGKAEKKARNGDFAAR